MKQFSKYTIQFCVFTFLIATVIKTDAFIYPFLYGAYLQHVLSMGLLAILLIELLFKNSVKGFDWGASFLIMIWCLYMWTHSFLTSKTEYYYLTYFSNGCIIIILLAFFLKKQSIQITELFRLLLFFNIIIAVQSLLQFAGILETNSPLFKISGSFDNPNTSAMLITLTIPVIFSFYYQYTKARILMVGTLALDLFALIVLQCRTAYVGLIIILILYLIKTRKIKSFKLVHGGAFVLLVVTLGAFYYLQNEKKSSADGRTLIWKITTDMIAQKPISGTGYGFFQKEYNLKLASYFKEEDRPLTEKMNAGFTSMAYNEILQQSAMGGLFGGLIYCLFAGFMLYKAWRIRGDNYSVFVAIVAFFAMSMVNFSFENPQILFISGVYISIVLSKTSCKYSLLSKPTSLAITGFMILFVAMSLPKFEAQKQLSKAQKHLRQHHFFSANKILADIESDISTSEAYYKIQSACLYRTNRPNEVLLSLQKAALYSTNSNLYLNMAGVAESLGEQTKAENYYLLAKNMEPHLYKPMVMLMQFYARNNSTGNALSIANEIIILPPKFNTEKVKVYKEMAQQCINSINK